MVSIHRISRLAGERGWDGRNWPTGRSIRRGPWVRDWERIDASAIQHAAETQWSDEWAHTCLATTFALLGCPWLNPLWELSSSIGLRVRLCSAANMFQSKRRTESWSWRVGKTSSKLIVNSVSFQIFWKPFEFFWGVGIILTFFLRGWKSF